MSVISGGSHPLDEQETAELQEAVGKLSAALIEAERELVEEKRRTKAQLAEREKDYSKTLKESAAEVERLTSELAEAKAEPDAEDTAPAVGPTDFVLQEIARERIAQDAKWGEQNHPLLDPALIGREPQRMATEYEVPHAGRAQFLCQTAAKRGQVTWGHILVEEVSEFICANPQDVKAMREELVQIAAVAVAAIESLDRKFPF